MEEKEKVKQNGYNVMFAMIVIRIVHDLTKQYYSSLEEGGWGGGGEAGIRWFSLTKYGDMYSTLHINYSIRENGATLLKILDQRI